MPRRKPRNLLKRKEVEFDAAPNVMINPRRISKKLKGLSSNEEEQQGGAMPKEFKRLMHWSLKKQGKLEDSATVNNNDKKKNNNNSREEAGEQRGRSRSRIEDTATTTISDASSQLKILPGERMSDFSRRVDEALPLVKARKGSPSRADKRRAKKRARAEQNNKKKDGSDDDQEDDDNATSNSTGKGGRREKSPDPWAHLESQKPKFGDVVDRPPELKLPSKLLRNVPKSAGSIARRVILEEERDRVIQSYRALMKEKRGDE